MTTTPETLYPMIAKHVLVPLAADRIEAFYLKDPDAGRMGSTLIVFSPEGIALLGDLTPERNGTVSALGYGKAWFAGRLSSSYLCEKFLEKKWVRELAGPELRDRQFWRDCYGVEDERELDEIADLATQLDDRGPEWLHEELTDLTGQCIDELPGWGYDPRESGWLIAIQRRFSELMTPKDAAVGEAALPAPAVAVA